MSNISFTDLLIIAGLLASVYTVFGFAVYTVLAAVLFPSDDVLAKRRMRARSKAVRKAFKVEAAAHERLVNSYR